MLKHLLSVTLFLTLAISSAFAQEQRTCHTMETLERLKKEDPAMALRMQQIEQQTTNYRNARTSGAGNIASAVGVDEVATINVVVHVLYRTTQENISDAQIQSQIDVLNEDFRKLNADAGNVPSMFAGLASDVKLQFKLATTTPTGAPTNGITRKSSTKTSWGTNDAMKKASAGGTDPWDTKRYLNIWVCNIGGGILGYAQFPGGSAATDGVVVGPQYFGRVGYLSAPFDKGRTATHEVGHYLNLRHIWGDASCGNDYVADTPTQQTSNGGCPTFPKPTCNNSSDMFMNYMDYTNDACMNMFSAGQKDRMRALFVAGGVREALVAPIQTACAVPSNLSATAITNTSATLNWSAVSGANSFGVRVRAQGTTTWSNFTSATNAYNVTGLALNTTYEYQVSANCSTGSSAYSATATVKTTGGTTTPTPATYCASKGNSTSDEWIQKVTLGAISNTSGNNNGYGNYTNLTTTLTKGTANTITITPGWAGTKYSEGYAVWIDYNQDGDFTDAGEQVYSRTRTTVTPVSGSFTVPAAALTGATRMRVAMKYNATPTSCETFSYGEVEDYTVNIATNLTARPATARTTPGNSAGVRIYPNPTENGEATVQFLVADNSDVELSVVDMTGRKVAGKTWNDVSGTIEHPLNLSNLNKGMYLIMIRNGKEKLTEKLIVR